MADSAAPASGTKPSSSVKLVLLGEAAVGKSSLVLRFVNDEFQENKEPTIGAAFLTQKCPLPHRLIKFEIWDTAGQERFASLAPMYYRNAQSALVVYDLTKPTSLLKAKHWVAELQRQASPGIVIALVGNKLDLCDEEGSGPPATPTPSRRTPTMDNNDADADADADDDAEGPTTTAPEPTEEPEDDLSGDRRKISTAEARLYAEEEGLLFYETSAKTGFAVQDVFTAIAGAIPESSMKGARGSGAAAGAGGTLGARGDAEAANRVNLNGPRGGEAAKDGCAC